MFAEEAKQIHIDLVTKQLDTVHMIIEGFTKLGTRAVSIDQRLAGLHPWVIKQLKDEGYLVTSETHTNPETKESFETIYIDWH